MEYKIYNINRINNNGFFIGYASIFNIEDSYKDLVLPNAFANSLKNKNLEDIKMLWQHNPETIIGKYININEDYMGLKVEGQINLSNKNIVSDLIKNNYIKGLSIGYRVINADYDKKGRRILKNINLIEISLVKFPANKFAKIIFYK